MVPIAKAHDKTDRANNTEENAAAYLQWLALSLSLHLALAKLELLQTD